MLLSSTAGSTASVCVLDWGEGTRPSIDVNAPVQHFQLDHDGQDLLVVSGGKATLRFSVRNDAGSVNGETVVPVIGISDIGDAVGFDTRVLAHAADGDGFDRVRKARLSVDHGKEKISGIPGPYRPEKQCCSGGTGSTSCSSHGQTNSCSVTCAGGYYACCDCTGMECTCVKN